MPNFNQIEKSEILRLIQEQSFHTLLQNILNNIKQEKNWGLIIVGKLTFVAKKIVQEGFVDDYKLQLAIRDIRYQSYSKDQSQILLSLLQSLLKVIQLNSRHTRDLKKLKNKESKPKLSLLAPSFTRPNLEPTITIQYKTQPEELNLSIQQQQYPITPPATPPSDYILMNQQHPLPSDSSSNRENSQCIQSSNSDWEDEESLVSDQNSDLSFYEGGEPEPNQNFTHIDQNIRIINQENLIKVSDSPINQKLTFNQQITQQQQLLNRNTDMGDNQNQIVAQQSLNHNDQYQAIYQGLLQTQNRIIPFDSFEKYNEIKEKVVSLCIQSSLTFLHSSISRICNSIQEIFDNGQVYQCMTAKGYKPNRMDAPDLESHEFTALKAILGILIKFLSSDENSILRIEHQTDIMFKRNTLLFKTLGKAAFSQKKPKQRISKQIQETHLTKIPKLLNQNLELELKLIHENKSQSTSHPNCFAEAKTLEKKSQRTTQKIKQEQINKKIQTTKEIQKKKLIKFELFSQFNILMGLRPQHIIA